jgi:enoyl-CoA hydratase
VSDRSELVGVSHNEAGTVATVTVQRPDKLNALNADVIAQLTAAFQGLRDADTPPRCAILTGEGRAFIAGADIGAMAEMTPVQAKTFAATGHAFGTLLEGLPFPIIAAVNGFALGGGLEVALACDFIYASDKAKVGQPEVKLGVIPGFGGTQRLLRRVGVGMARELCYSGRLVDAAEALRIGLVNRVLPADELMAEVAKVAEEIADQAPLAVAAAKRVILRGEGIGLEAANELEAQTFAGLFGSEDQRGGMAAFMKKEKASFSGR